MSDNHSPYIIVLGNEKGGTGKSTAAMHIITSLLRQGYKVGSIDVDARQGTLSRYVENRRLRSQANPDEHLPLPEHYPVFRSEKSVVEEAQVEDEENLKAALEKLKESDYIVVDTPGSDMYLSRLAHSYADTLITPLNDSFIDLDMLARLNPETMEIVRPSTYSEMVWEQKKQRAIRGDRRAIDWIVLRNRLTSVNSRNKEEMRKALESLSKRIGFRLVAGFGERVIFRELFLNGITLLDLRETRIAMSLSHIAARQELNQLLEMIQIPKQKKKAA
jgi:chromosome partitioning protein